MKERKEWKMQTKGIENYLLVGVILLLVALPCLGHAAIPQKIGYQGYLTDAKGIPIHQTLSITFKIYMAPSGGSALWMETQNVTVTNGVYSVNLGDVAPLGLPFDVPYYLGVGVGSDPEMTPRQPLSSVGYAFRASSADGVGAHVHSGVDITAGVISEARIDPLIARDSEVTVSVNAHATRADNPHSTTAAQAGAVALNQANSITSTMIVDSQVTKSKLSATGGTNGQVLGTDGTNLVWQTGSGGGLTLPYIGWLITNQAAFWVSNLGATGTGIWGLATDGIGVFGEGNGSPGWGVWGKHTGTGNYGQMGTAVAGLYAFGYGNSRGVHGQSQNATGVHGQSGNGYGAYGESTSGTGVMGVNAGSGNYGELGTGVAAIHAEAFQGVGAYILAPNDDGVKAASGGNAKSGVYGFNTNTGGYGVYGANLSNGNFGWLGGLYGAYGRSDASAGRGVMGYATGSQGAGVYGEASGSDGTAVYATASGNKGVGLYAEGASNGYAAQFKGNVQILSKSTSAVILEMGEGLDYAEGFHVSDRANIKPGSVLIIDPDNPGKLKLGSEAYDQRVAGIAAGARNLGSGVRLGAGQFDTDVALAGRVYCNVDSTYGEVKPGDLLTTSPTPGFAMVVKDHMKAQGAILGKAMEKLPEGRKGQILVLVTLQ
jgi:hypothetical protein